jgi:hypothetical protein
MGSADVFLCDVFGQFYGITSVPPPPAAVTFRRAVSQSFFSFSCCATSTRPELKSRAAGAVGKNGIGIFNVADWFRHSGMEWLCVTNCWSPITFPSSCSFQNWSNRGKKRGRERGQQAFDDSGSARLTVAGKGREIGRRLTGGGGRSPLVDDQKHNCAPMLLLGPRKPRTGFWPSFGVTHFPTLSESNPAGSSPSSPPFVFCRHWMTCRSSMAGLILLSLFNNPR